MSIVLWIVGALCAAVVLLWLFKCLLVWIVSRENDIS